MRFRGLGHLRRLAGLPRVKGELPPPRPRHADPFATHLPVLIGLARLLPVRRVVEFGSGLVSTPAFLNRSLFPDLSELISVENDPEWAATVRDAVSDARLDLRTASGAVAAAVSADLLSGTDLVLVDDSVTAAERVATLEAVLSLRLRVVVAVHDFEVDLYRLTAEQHGPCTIFRGYTPQTGVVDFGERLDPRAVRALERMIHKHAASLPPSDSEAWSARLATTSERRFPNSLLPTRPSIRTDRD